MDCEFAEFLDLNGYQVSQQKAQLIKEKEAVCGTPRASTQSYLQASSVHCREAVYASWSDLQEEPLDNAEDS